MTAYACIGAYKIYIMPILVQAKNMNMSSVTSKREKIYILVLRMYICSWIFYRKFITLCMSTGSCNKYWIKIIACVSSCGRFILQFIGTCGILTSYVLCRSYCNGLAYDIFLSVEIYWEQRILLFRVYFMVKWRTKVTITITITRPASTVL